MEDEEEESCRLYYCAVIRVRYLSLTVYPMAIHGRLCCCFVSGMLFLSYAV